VLVDTGCLDDDARARGMRDYVSPAETVERAGVKPADVPLALMTHLHCGHRAGPSLFPAGGHPIQRDAAASRTGPSGRRPAVPPPLAAIETMAALAGPARRIVARHDPQVSERFTPIDRGIIRIA